MPMTILHSLTLALDMFHSFAVAVRAIQAQLFNSHFLLMLRWAPGSYKLTPKMKEMNVQCEQPSGYGVGLPVTKHSYLISTVDMIHAMNLSNIMIIMLMLDNVIV